MRLLAFAASLRRGSFNKKLIQVAAQVARTAGAEVDLADFREFDMPLYDADLQHENGFPPGAEELAQRILTADGILLATPEYNYSIPGTLKNAIDWISRKRPMPTIGKTVLLLAASQGMIAGHRGLWQTRIPLEGCGAFVYPDMYGLGQSAAAFDAEGAFSDPKQKERLEKLTHGFLQFTEKLAPSGV